MDLKAFLPKAINSPPKIYLWWSLLIFLFCLTIPILSSGVPGGEQRPLVLLSYAINYLVYGYLIIAIVSSVIFLNGLNATGL
jgi:hypothetical protein